jgi:hypothetical protein
MQELKIKIKEVKKERRELTPDELFIIEYCKPNGSIYLHNTKGYEYNSYKSIDRCATFHSEKIRDATLEESQAAKFLIFCPSNSEKNLCGSCCSRHTACNVSSRIYAESTLKDKEIILDII